MKRIIFVIFVFTLGYFLWPEPEPEPETSVVQFEEELEFEENIVPEPSPEPQKSISRPKLIVQQPTQWTAPKSKTNKGRRLPPGVVEFELIKGNWAVAHGDILLGQLQSEHKASRGQFKPKKSILWESNIIPYAFSNTLSRERMSEIENVMKELSVVTSLEMLPVNPQDPPQDYIVFTHSDERCASYLGKVGGQQPIFLKENCGPKEILHEVMHALGFVHEQSRKDRDRYVKINWDNIQEGFENQFDVAPDAYLEIYRGFVFNFDYESVMLYSPFHFAKKGTYTIESTTNKAIAPSQNGLSPVDIQRINYLYGG